jgi:hypothetical protein
MFHMVIASRIALSFTDQQGVREDEEPKLCMKRNNQWWWCTGILYMVFKLRDSLSLLHGFTPIPEACRRSSLGHVHFMGRVFPNACSSYP